MESVEEKMKMADDFMKSFFITAFTFTLEWVLANLYLPHENAKKESFTAYYGQY